MDDGNLCKFIRVLICLVNSISALLELRNHYLDPFDDGFYFATANAEYDLKDIQPTCIVAYICYNEIA